MSVHLGTYHRIWANSAIVTGRVTQLYLKPTRYGPKPHVAYEFSDGDHVRAGDSQVSTSRYEQLRLNDSVEVCVAHSAESCWNHLVGAAADDPEIIVLEWVAGVPLAVGLFVSVTSDLLRAARQRRLARWGVPTIATIDRVSRTRSLRLEPSSGTQYTFRTTNGRAARGSMAAAGLGQTSPAIGDQFVVLFLPHHPKQNAVYDALAYRAKMTPEA